LKLSSHFILTVKSVGYKRVDGGKYFIKFLKYFVTFNEYFVLNIYTTVDSTS